MSLKTIEDSSLSAIANAIRGKNGASDTYTPAQMAAAIAAIPSGVLGTKSITANGTYAASSDSLDGYSSVTVDVPSAALGTKTITANGTYSASADSLDGYSSVTVNVSGGGGTMTPAYAGLSYGFLTNTCYFFGYTAKTNYMNFYELGAGDSVVCFAESGDRFRAGFFAGKTYQDFEQYVENSSSNTSVYSPTDSIATTGDVCTYTAAAAGMLVVMTSASGQTAPATAVVM